MISPLNKKFKFKTGEEDTFPTAKNLANPFTPYFEIACPLCEEKQIKYFMRKFLFRSEFIQRQRKITDSSHSVSH